MLAMMSVIVDDTFKMC